jgi:hypothetical protein
MPTLFLSKMITSSIFFYNFYQEIKKSRNVSLNNNQFSLTKRTYHKNAFIYLPVTLRELTGGQLARCSVWEPADRGSKPATHRPPLKGGVRKIPVQKKIYL